MGFLVMHAGVLVVTDIEQPEYREFADFIPSEGGE